MKLALNVGQREVRRLQRCECFAAVPGRRPQERSSLLRIQGQRAVYQTSELQKIDAGVGDDGAGFGYWNTGSVAAESLGLQLPTQRALEVCVVQPDLIWYATRHLAIISAKGGEPRLLTESLDRRVSSPRFTPDGRRITFLLEDSAERHLARIDTDGRNLTRIIPGQRSVRTYTAHKSGRIATIISDPHIPGEIYIYDERPATETAVER